MVAGTAGGLRLDSPAGLATRPTSDRVRQAVFNALESLGAVEEARVVDAFAGSGALGIEALSRGASHAVFADTDAAARDVITRNLHVTGLAGVASVVGAPGSAVVVRNGPWDLVLLDPPYDHGDWEGLLSAVVRSITPQAVVVLESDREIALPAGLHATRVKRYGGTVVTFAVPPGATP